MTLHVLRRVVGFSVDWSAGWLVSLSVIKGWKVALPCSYRSTCLTKPQAAAFLQAVIVWATLIRPNSFAASGCLKNILKRAAVWPPLGGAADWIVDLSCRRCFGLFIIVDSCPLLVYDDTAGAVGGEAAAAAAAAAATASTSRINIVNDWVNSITQLTAPSEHLFINNKNYLQDSLTAEDPTSFDAAADGEITLALHPEGEVALAALDGDVGLAGGQRMEARVETFPSEKNIKFIII